MAKKIIVLGDHQVIDLKFPDAKAGDIWGVDVQVRRPDGVIQSYGIEYEFTEAMVRRTPDLPKKGRINGKA